MARRTILAEAPLASSFEMLVDFAPAANVSKVDCKCSNRTERSRSPMGR